MNLPSPWVASLLNALDATMLHVLHYGSSRRSLQELRSGNAFGSDAVLAATDRVVVDRNIERERRRLLVRRELLDPEGPFDKGMTIGAACAVSKAPRQAALLAALTREFAPGYAMELGTNVGISSSYIASSMKSGRLVTMEASPARAALAREVHVNLALDNVEYAVGLFEQTLDDVLAKAPPVELVFIDGHHLYKPTMDYLERIVAHAADRAVFIFDDIRWSEGMERAWSEISMDERFGLVADFWTMGLCVLRAPEAPRLSVGPITRY